MQDAMGKQMFDVLLVVLGCCIQFLIETNEILFTRLPFTSLAMEMSTGSLHLG